MTFNGQHFYFLISTPTFSSVVLSTALRSIHCQSCHVQAQIFTYAVYSGSRKAGFGKTFTSLQSLAAKLPSWQRLEAVPDQSYIKKFAFLITHLMLLQIN